MHAVVRQVEAALRNKRARGFGIKKSFKSTRGDIRMWGKRGGGRGRRRRSGKRSRR